MKKIACLLVLLVVGCSVETPCVGNRSTKYFEEPLVVTLELEKDAYSLTDVINAKIILANNGKTNVIVNSRMALNFSAALASDRDIELIISQPSGDAVPFIVKLRIAPLANGDFVVLESGDSIQQSYDLRDYYQLDEIGEYTITAIYENQSDPSKGICTWKGKLESNKVSFTLTP
jgi:hypothetical protein